MKEGPLDIILNAALLALVLYLLMRYVLGQSNVKALHRSVLSGLMVAVYVMLFGYGLPNRQPRLF